MLSARQGVAAFAAVLAAIAIVVIAIPHEKSVAEVLAESDRLMRLMQNEFGATRLPSWGNPGLSDAQFNKIKEQRREIEMWEATRPKASATPRRAGNIIENKCPGTGLWCN